MYYHPFMGITIFLIAVVISFYFGRMLLKKSQKKMEIYNSDHDKSITPPIPKGEITSPDAPWLKDR